MSHDEAFAAFQARRDEERAARGPRVTWRKISADTGGGWSGLGPGGSLVLVRRTSSGYAYGFTALMKAGEEPSGYAATLARAKKAAAELFNEAPTAAQERSTTMSPENIPTAESLMEGLGQAVAPSKSSYARLRTENGTLGYALPRKTGVVLDFTTASVAGAPKRFAPFLAEKGRGRTIMTVTASNAKAARALLEWVDKRLAA